MSKRGFLSKAVALSLSLMLLALAHPAVAGSPSPTEDNGGRIRDGSQSIAQSPAVRAAWEAGTTLRFSGAAGAGSVSTRPLTIVVSSGSGTLLLTLKLHGVAHDRTAVGLRTVFRAIALLQRSTSGTRARIQASTRNGLDVRATPKI